MDYQASFESALDTESYCSLLGNNSKLHERHLERAEVDSYRSRLEGALPPLKIVVLTEPWCGDSVAIVPVLLKLLEGNQNVEIRFLLRDENAELMDLHLTNGARSIPKIIVLDAGYNVRAVWGPRPKAAQAIFTEMRADIEAGRSEKFDAIKKIRNFYSRDKGDAIATELTETLLASAS